MVTESGKETGEKGKRAGVNADDVNCCDIYYG
jgi:hypothetical protein